MKKRGYACESHIRNIKELKKQGIKDFYCETTYINKKGELKRLEPVKRNTANGQSAYANDMYKKYGDACEVEIYYFDKNYNIITYTVYSA